MTPGGPTSENFLVSRATREILNPFGGVRMYSLMPQRGLMPQRPYATKGLCHRRTKRAEDFRRRARTGDHNALAPRRCDTKTVRVRSLSRFSRVVKNPQPFWEGRHVQPYATKEGLCHKGATKGLCHRGGLMPQRAYATGAPKGLRIFHAAQETGNITHSLPAGVTPRPSASDHSLVSRAS